MIWVWMAVAGGLGAVARAWLAPRAAVGRFSGVSVVNLSGTLALVGLVVAGVGADALFVVGVGFFGAYTTFSSWMLEVLDRSNSEGPDAVLGDVAKVCAAAVAVALLTLIG